MKRKFKRVNMKLGRVKSNLQLLQPVCDRIRRGLIELEMVSFAGKEEEKEE